MIHRCTNLILGVGLVEDTITFRIACTKPVKLTLQFRLPVWLASLAEVEVNGKPLAAEKVPAPIVVRKTKLKLL